jgi:hypothetical protein
MNAEAKVVNIDSKILGVSVAKPAEAAAPVKPEPVIVREQMGEKVRRPEVMSGRTYKVRVPDNILEHALYVTINDIVLNEGTEHETVQPFEIFLSSKDTKAFQWVSALSLLISAIFRKGGDVLFLIDELKSVSDPNGGYFHGKSHGVMPSLVAHIGYTIEDHFKHLGLIKTEAVVLDAATQARVEEVKTTYVQAGGSLDNATVCKVCKEKAVIRLDNCPTCTNCGDSKCG